MRLSIDVTPEQHQRLKAIAALRGQTIKDYVLTRVLPNPATQDEDKALQQLEAFLEPRLKEVSDAPAPHKSVQALFEETLQDMKSSNAPL